MSLDSAKRTFRRKLQTTIKDLQHVDTRLDSMIVDKFEDAVNDYDWLFAEDEKNAMAEIIADSKLSTVVVGENPGDVDTDVYQALFTALVPGEGNCKTIEGEMLRAIAKIRYRKGNDGDLFHRGYGKETCGGPANFLMTCKVPGLEELLNQATGEDGVAYSNTIDRILALIVKHIESLGSDNLTPNVQNIDMYDDQFSAVESQPRRHRRIHRRI